MSRPVPPKTASTAEDWVSDYSREKTTVAKSNKSIRTIRENAGAIEKLIERLETSQEEPGASKRQHKRYRYRQKQLTAEIKQPGDPEAVSYVVEPINLSQGGAAFLFGGYIHAGSECNVRLISLHGSWSDVPGHIVGCKFVAGNIHIISVKFNQNIDPQHYCSSAIHHRVLLAEDDPLIGRLATALLTKLGANVDLATDGSTAIEMVSQKVYDLILMDIEMPQMNGLDATRALRQKGYSGRIVAATAKTRPEDRQKCLEAGCDDYMPKPHTLENLAKVLESVSEEPIFSTLSNDPTMVDFVESFVSNLPIRIRAIEDALANQDGAELENLARNLKGEGTSYGFEVLTDQAAKVEEAAVIGSEFQQIKHEVNELISLCLQVRSSVVSDSVPK
ncbi:MAG: hypothetical protein DHS20C16_29060 [Phycisphaerae bacterium]|nr:MAG: hypothetical protein DHS20C16_29060 [Phycisphaerae bacterium]